MVLNYVVKIIKIHISFTVFRFAVWNTMMGTSLLSMPWAMERAGILPAVILLTSVAAISFYTAYRMLQVFEANGNNINICKEIHDLFKIIRY